MLMSFNLKKGTYIDLCWSQRILKTTEIMTHLATKEDNMINVWEICKLISSIIYAF